MTDFSALRVIDGGVGMLANKLTPRPDPNPLWGCRLVREAPGKLRDLHLQFLRSGANVIETNSYQFSVPKLMKVYGIGCEEAADLIAESGRIAKQAVENFVSEKKDLQTPLIAGSIGPYGAYLADLSEYNGSYARLISVEELKNHHRPQLQALAPQCDFFALETVPCVKEAEAFVALLREFPNHRAWISFISTDGRTTCAGEALDIATVAAARGENVFALGINCGMPPRLVGPALEIMSSKVNNKMLIAYPNQGEQWSDEEECFLVKPVKSIADCVPEWVSLGCRWIGGCCGVDPNHTAEIARAVNSLRE